MNAEGTSALDADPVAEHTAQILVAVRDRAGAVIAALTASGATLRLPTQRLSLLGRVALEQAHAVSARLGHGASLAEYLESRPPPRH